MAGHAAIPPEEASAFKRWAIACVVAIGGTALFMFLVIRPDELVTILPQPLMELGYMLLPPEPKEAPKPIKPPPPPVKITEPLPEPVPAPPALAPVEASEPSSGPADVQSSNVETPKPTPQPVPDIQLTSTAQLDNTDFVPLVNIKPEYPAIALKANIEGYVDVDLIIDEKGKVESFSLASVYGHPSFGNATAKVVPRWRFPPPRIKGNRVRVKYLYRVNFTLD